MVVPSPGHIVLATQWAEEGLPIETNSTTKGR